MGKVKYFLAFSALFILFGRAGVRRLKAHQGKLADVDFTGGTQVQFDLRKPDARSRPLRSVFAKADNAGARGRARPDRAGSTATPATGWSRRTRTPGPSARPCSTCSGGRITPDLPSRFAHVERADRRQAMADKAVLPIPSTGLTVGDYKVPHTDDYIGGVALVLDGPDSRR